MAYATIMVLLSQLPLLLMNGVDMWGPYIPFPSHGSRYG